MRKILALIVLFTPLICSAQDATIAESAQRSIEAAQFHQNLIIIFVIISIFANKIIFFSNYLIQTQPEILPLQLIGILFGKKRGGKLKIVDREGNPVSFAKASVVDQNDNLISTYYGNLGGIVQLSVPRNGSVIVSGFGFTKKIIKPDRIGSSNQIVLKKTPDVYIEKGNYHSRTIARWTLAITTILGIYLLTAISGFYPQIVTLLLTVVVISNTLVILRNRPRSIQLLNSKGNPARDSKVTFCSARGDKIKESSTNSRGKIVAILTPAFYTIKTPTAHAKTFNIERQSLANLRLKLG